MLEYLHIRNLALIEDMVLEFSDGINVLTGETGAGKSFILKALGFLLGDKLSSEIVRPGAEKAQVEALFRLPDKDLVLKRELAAASGRSRFYINDSLASQDALKDLRGQLISHTSQHAQQQLLQPNFQSAMLERSFSRPDLLHKRDELVEQLRTLDNQAESLQKKQESLLEKRELLEMWNEEIEKIDPRPGEEERLEQARSALRAAEGAHKNYAKAMAILHGDENPGLLRLLGDLSGLLAQMGKDDPSLLDTMKEVEEFRGGMSQLANEFRRPPLPRSDLDPDQVEGRLFAFAQLKRKLKRTMPQILELKDEIKENLSFLDACALDISHIKREMAKIGDELKKTLSEIAPLRRDAAAKFASQLERQLKDLGFSEHARVIPEFVQREIWPGIIDEKGRVTWAPNPGQNPQALDKIASGGELSRFLLGLVILDQDANDLTYIFDEVDAGIGGMTLNKVSEKLQNLARNRQIILITHWPQLAAKAATHFQISKEVKDNSTFTTCKPLDAKGRFAELARMSGGGKEGDAMAKNLLA